MSQLESIIARFATSKPKTALLASFMMISLLVYGLKFIQFDADPSIYFSDDHEHYRYFKALEETYGRVDSVMMVIKAQEGSLFTPKNLALIESLTDQAWQLPYATRVDSLSNYNFSWSEADELIVEPLIENASNFDHEQIERIRNIALQDPDIVKRLISDEKALTMVRVIATLPMENRQVEESLMAEAARKLAKTIEAEYENIDILLSGNVISNTTVTEVATEDVLNTVPLMYAVIFIMLGLLLRSITAVVAIFLVTVLSSLCALGVASWLGIVLNMMSVTCINIIVTVSIAHCVHILVYYLKAYHQGTEKKQALRESIIINFTPISLTSLTTALGFLSMNFSKMPPAHDLGNITAIGVLLAFILSLFLLPPLLLLLPLKKRQLSSGGRLNKMMLTLADWVIQQRKLLLVGTVLFSLVILAFAPLNTMNDRFTENVKLPNTFRIDNTEIDQYFGGLYTIEYDFSAKEPGGIADPEYLNALEKMATWLRQQPEVKSVQSYSDIIKRLNQNMHNDNPEFYAIPKTRDEAAQYQLIYEMSQPMGSDMTNLIKIDKSGTRLIASLPSTDTSDLINLQQRAQDWVAENLPDYMFYSGEGIAVMWAYLGQEAIIDGLKGALLALFLISIILMAVFKSVKYGLISLIPNLLPAGIGYGVWAIIDGELSMGQMLVLSITIGIVVDDTVHFLSKYMRAKNQFNDSEQAVKMAFEQVGPALWITTAVLILGFGMLTLSGFIPNSNLGLLTVFIITAALLLDFFLLPPLLMAIDRIKSKRKDKDPIEKDLAITHPS